MGQIHSRALRRAAEILGGTSELCDYLHVPAGELRRWLEGRDAPPAGIFFRVVDLIVEQAADAAAPEAGASAPEPCAPPSAGDRREPA